MWRSLPSQAAYSKSSDLSVQYYHPLLEGAGNRLEHRIPDSSATGSRAVMRNSGNWRSSTVQSRKQQHGVFLAEAHAIRSHPGNRLAKDVPD